MLLLSRKGVRGREKQNREHTRNKRDFKIECVAERERER